jgi:hypothetical protein
MGGGGQNPNAGGTIPAGIDPAQWATLTPEQQAKAIALHNDTSGNLFASGAPIDPNTIGGPMGNVGGALAGGQGAGGFGGGFRRGGYVEPLAERLRRVVAARGR